MLMQSNGHVQWGISLVMRRIQGDLGCMLGAILLACLHEQIPALTARVPRPIARSLRG